MKKSMREGVYFISLMAALLFLGGCDNNAGLSEKEGSLEADLDKVTVGYSRLRISLPIFVAMKKGIFEKNGLDVDLKMYETAQPLMQALVEGKIDLAGYTALPITYNAMLRSEKQLLFISTMVEDQEHRISYLLKPKGGEISKISELKGKKVGILPTIAYKAWLEAMLKHNGLEPGVDVVIQQIAPALQAKMLQSGGVNALFTNDPVATSAIQAGVAELVTKEVELPKYLRSPFPFGSFNISKEWAEQNKSVFGKVVKSLDEAIYFVNSHPAESKLMMKGYLPDSFKDHVTFYPNALYLTSGDSDEAVFNEIAEKYLEIGIIKKPISLKGLVVKD